MFNAILVETATGLTTAICKDGQTTCTASIPFAAGISVTGTATLNSAVVLNESGGDNDIRMESDTNSDHFVSDAGMFGGVGAFGFGTIHAGSFFSVDQKALTAVANNDYYRAVVQNTNAVTIPAGVAGAVASLVLTEPNITATGTVTLAATLYVTGAPTEGTSNYAIYVSSGTVALNGRFLAKRGASVAAANDLTLGSDGNSFILTGATQINRIATAGWQAGAVVILLFSEAVTVAHGTAGGGGFASILLSGAGNMSATADDALQLCYDGSNWREIGRAVI